MPMSHSYILEARNLFSFTGSQLRGILPLDESYLKTHSYLI